MKANKKLQVFFIGLAFTMAILLYADFAAAQGLRDATGQLEAGGTKSGLFDKGKGATDPRVFLAEFIKIANFAFGMIMVILMVMAGYWYITAHGEQEKITKATKTIMGATIGLIIVIMSYGIATFVGKKAVEVTGYGEGVGDEVFVNCCKVCDVGGLINTGCEFVKAERGACTAKCEESAGVEQRGDCQFVGYIEQSECRFGGSWEDY